MMGKKITLMLLVLLALSLPVGAAVISVNVESQKTGEVYIARFGDITGSYVTGTQTEWNVLNAGDSDGYAYAATTGVLGTMDGSATSYDVKFTIAASEPAAKVGRLWAEKDYIFCQDGGSNIIDAYEFSYTGLVAGQSYDILFKCNRNYTQVTIDGVTKESDWTTSVLTFNGVIADESGVITGDIRENTDPSVTNQMDKLYWLQIKGNYDVMGGTPSSGAEVPMGDVLLSWTNFPAGTSDPANDPVWVDVWFGTDPDDSSSFTKVIDVGQDLTSVMADASAEGTYYWRVDSYLYGDPAVVDYDIDGTDPTKYPVLHGLLWHFESISSYHLPEDLYVDLEDISNPTFEELLDPGVSPTIPDGVTSYGPIYGSTIDAVNHLFETGPYANRPIENNVKIHTLCNSAIGRSNFPKWTRWYQEDGNTQIFRLFTGERNVRNDREGAARVESFSGFHWGPGVGPWNEWTGRYTIVKPHSCAIFQAKNNINDWGIMLNLSSTGDITLNHRRYQDDVVIARNMTGKSFDIRVLDNGLDYMVWLNGDLVGTGYYDRPEGTTGFRWGMYDGTIGHDAMVFVSGATVRTNVDPGLYTPSVDAGDDMITWSGEGVDMAPSYSEGYTPSSWTWSAEPADGVEFSPDAYAENPTVTITKATDNPSSVTLTITVNDGTDPLIGTMTIDVYDDACKASIGSGRALNPGDIDGDCITNLKDLAILAETWLLDTRTTGSVINE